MLEFESKISKLIIKKHNKWWHSARTLSLTLTKKYKEKFFNKSKLTY